MPGSVGKAVSWSPVEEALSQGDVVMALELFEERLGAGHEAPQPLVQEVAAAQISHGNDLSRREIWDRALERYRRARKLDPWNGEAAFRMGRAFRALGAHAAALDCFRAAQELLKEPGDQFSRHYLADAHFQEGLTLLDQGQIRSARKALEQALKVKAEYSEARSVLNDLSRRVERQSGEGGSEEKLIGQVLDAVASSNPDRRREAMISLREFPEFPEIREVLVKISDADPDPDVRFEARRTLGQLPPSSQWTVGPDWRGENGQLDLSRLSATLASDNLALRREALHAALIEPDVTMAPMIAGHIRREEDPLCLAQAVALLGRTGSRVDVPLIEPLLQDRSCRVVANTIEAITQLAGALPGSSLLSLLESRDNRVRGNAVLCAMGARRPPVVEHLRQMAASDKLAMRASALYCLERLQDPAVETIALDMFQEETTAELTWKITSLLARIGTARILPRLEEIAEFRDSRQGYAVFLINALRAQGPDSGNQ